MNVEHSAVELNHKFEKMSFGDNKVRTALAEKWLHEHKTLFCWIDGKFCESSCEFTTTEISLTNKENRSISIKVAEGINNIEEAVMSSNRAQSEWEKKTTERLDILYLISTSLRSKEELFSQLLGQNVKNDFKLFCDYFHFYSDEQINSYDEWTPIGIVALILSSKTPLWVLGMEVAAALHSGCSVIIKPHEKDPFSSYLLAEISKSAGLPPGLLNIVPGSTSTSGLLSKNFGKVIFNGTHGEANHLKMEFPLTNLSFFNTNHTASIVLETCDIQSAVDKIFSETWNCNYQTSWGICVTVVQESVSDIFIEKLTSKIKNFTHQTPIPRKFTAVDTINDALKILLDAEETGAKVVKSSTTENALGPSLILEYLPNFREAPVMALLICRTAKEAVGIVNNFPYSLATSVWTENVSQAMEVASKLQSSVIWINCHGIMHPEVILEPSRNSGNGCFGGIYGTLYFMNRNVRKCNGMSQNGGNAKDEIVNKTSIISKRIIESSCSSFASWQFRTDRKNYLKNIFHFMSASERFSKYSQIVNYWARNGNSYDISKSNGDDRIYVIQTKKPIGVIGIVLMDSDDIVRSFISLVLPAIIFGNVVVIVIPKESLVQLDPIIECFRKNLPEGVIVTIADAEAARVLCSLEAIQAIWLHSTNTAQIQEFEISCFQHFKHLWVTQSSLPECKILFSQYCLKSQAMWLTKVSHYP